METQETNQTAVKRGRKRNPAITRTIFLDANNKPRTKGAPKVGSEVKAVDVQRSVKNAEFNYETTPFTNERMVTIQARKPRTAKAVVVIPAVPVAEMPQEAAPVAVEAAANPLDEVVPVVGQGAYSLPN